MIEQAESLSASVVLHVALLAAVVIAFACLTVRWLLPLALRTLLEPLQDAIDILAAGMLFPEYWLSWASRRVIGRPPQLAYEYGSAVAWMARLVHSLIDRCFRGLEVAANAVPLTLIAVAAGGITVRLLLR